MLAALIFISKSNQIDVNITENLARFIAEVLEKLDVNPSFGGLSFLWKILRIEVFHASRKLDIESGAKLATMF